MKIKLSINKNIVNKENPASAGWHNVELTPDELMQSIMQGYAFSPGFLKEDASGKKPSNDDVEFSELLVVDVDNTISIPGEGKKEKRKREVSEGYLDYYNVASNSWSASNILLIYTTPSHTEDHHRFRIVFKLPQPIDNAEEFKKVSRPIILRLKGDPNACTISNTFFGSKNCQYKVFGASLTKKNLDTYLKAQQVEEKAMKEHKQSGINGSIPPAIVAEMLSHIPNEMEYLEWFKIVSAVGNYFSNDLDTACKLIDDWSPDTERGTMWRLKNRGKQFTIGSVIFYATANGFEKSKLYKYQSRSNSAVDADGKIVSNKKGRKSYKAGVREIQDYLSAKYDFRYNIIKSYVEYKLKKEKEYVQVTDRIENSLWCELELAGIEVPVGDINKVLTSDYVPDYHPFKEYFNDLPEWDGYDYIQDFVDMVTVPDDQYNTWLNYFTKWIVSVVACATETIRRDGQGRAVNHTCIVLVGSQGIGKTTIINRLIPIELLPYYASTQINPNDKDSKVLVTESFIINLDELESSTREEIASLKSLMTSEQISLRKAYARRSEVYVRRASFIGSVNKAMFLTDITGARRFLPVDVINIDLETKINIDQLYAQALFYLNQPDFKYWFDGKEIEVINDNNKKYQILSPEEELIIKHFKPYENADDLSPEEIRVKSSAGVLKLMTATDIFDFLQKKTEVKMSYHKLGQFLKNYGFQQKVLKIHEKNQRFYILTEHNNEESMNF